MGTATDMTISVGDVIAGKYRVERVLGTGAMGVVVAATHVSLGELRAIKLMRPKLAANAQYCDRFLHEAQAVARLRGEHVAKVHDVGTLDGVPYMVIEYVEGVDFSAMLKESGPLPPDRAVHYVLQAAEALAEAHKHGVVHRDIKPANLFLAKSNDGSPCVKVIDFGIAKTAADLTLVGVVLGSPRYMPPEQIRATREVDVRADIWALGVVLYELCTGETPFEGVSVLEVCERIIEDPVVPPSHLRQGMPAGLDAVILKCLEKDRDRRYQNVGELARALGPFAPEEARSLPARIARVLGIEGLPAAEVAPAPALAPAPAVATPPPEPLPSMPRSAPQTHAGRATETNYPAPPAPHTPTPQTTLEYVHPASSTVTQVGGFAPRPVGSVTETSLGLPNPISASAVTARAQPRAARASAFAVLIAMAALAIVAVMWVSRARPSAEHARSFPALRLDDLHPEVSSSGMKGAPPPPVDPPPVDPPKPPPPDPGPPVVPPSAEPSAKPVQRPPTYVPPPPPPPTNPKGHKDFPD